MAKPAGHFPPHIPNQNVINRILISLLVSGKGAAFLWDKENGREWSVRPRTVKTQAACWSDFSRAFFQARGVNSATVWFVARGRRSKMSFKYACGSTPCIRQLAIKV